MEAEVEAEMEAQAAAQAAAQAVAQAAAEQREAKGLIGLQPTSTIFSTSSTPGQERRSWLHRAAAVEATKAVGTAPKAVDTAVARAVGTAPALEQLVASLHSEWVNSVGEGGSDGDGDSDATPGTTCKKQECRISLCGWPCE